MSNECLMNAFKKSKIYFDGFVYIFANPWSVLRDYKFTNMQRLIYKIIMSLACILGFSAFILGFIWNSSNVMPIYLIIAALFISILGPLYLALYYPSTCKRIDRMR